MPLKTKRKKILLSSPVASFNTNRDRAASCELDNGGGLTKYSDFVVVGSGIAGLRYALAVAEQGTVNVVTKSEPHESNTQYAQGGVSAVLDPLDSVESHIRDTIVAGAFLCDEETVEVQLIFSHIQYCVMLYSANHRIQKGTPAPSIHFKLVDLNNFMCFNLRIFYFLTFHSLRTECLNS